MSDIKNLQKIVDDLNFAIEKLEEFEAIDELPQILDEIQTYTKSFKKQKTTSNIIITIFAFILSAFLGYFSAYYITSNKLAKTNLIVVLKGNTKQIYIPKTTWQGKELKNDYLFTKK